MSKKTFKEKITPYKETIIKAIINFITWGLIVGGILPFTTHFLLNHYQNKELRNQYIITQAFPDFEKSYISCNALHMKIIQNLSGSFNDYSLIETIVIKNKNQIETTGMMDKSSFQLLLALEKNSGKLATENQTNLEKLQLCRENTTIQASKLAFLLKITKSSKLESINNTYTKNTNKINSKQTNALDELAKEYGAPITPVDLDGIRKFDQWFIDNTYKTLHDNSSYPKTLAKFHFTSSIFKVKLHHAEKDTIIYQKYYTNLLKLFLDNFH